MWNETFSRASWFLTVISAVMITLGLIAQADHFGTTFRAIALFLLPVSALVGIATFIRLMDLNGEDVGLVAGINRLRHGYLDLAPDLEQYFITGHHDDKAGILQTYGGRRALTDKERRMTLLQYLSSTPLLIGIIDAILVGGVVGVACAALGTGPAVIIVAGGFAALITLGALVMVMARHIGRVWQLQPRFPS